MMREVETGVTIAEEEETREETILEAIPETIQEGMIRRREEIQEEGVTIAAIPVEIAGTEEMMIEAAMTNGAVMAIVEMGVAMTGETDAVTDVATDTMKLVSATRTVAMIVVMIATEETTREVIHGATNVVTNVATKDPILELIFVPILELILVLIPVLTHVLIPVLILESIAHLAPSLFHRCKRRARREK